MASACGGESTYDNNKKGTGPLTFFFFFFAAATASFAPGSLSQAFNIREDRRRIQTRPTGEAAWSMDSAAMRTIGTWRRPPNLGDGWRLKGETL